VVFTKALIDKFHWAMDCEMEFSFVQEDAVEVKPAE
jgi:DNA topoisomerase-1